MSTDDTFASNLAIGQSGEDLVYNWLTRNNSYVEDLRNHTRVGNTGPRLNGTEGSLVLPDFAVYNKMPQKGSFAVDVKVKNSVYSVNGKKCFTVDNKYEQYRRVVEIKKLDFLAIIFVYDGRMYFYKDSDCCGTTQFRNSFGTGNVYLFELDASKVSY
jgi:hypothetical protein